MISSTACRIRSLDGIFMLMAYAPFPFAGFVLRQMNGSSRLLVFTEVYGHYREGEDDLHSILEFEGVTAHQADDVDPQEYVNRLRDEWEDRGAY